MILILFWFVANQVEIQWALLLQNGRCAPWSRLCLLFLSDFTNVSKKYHGLTQDKNKRVFFSRIVRLNCDINELLENWPSNFFSRETTMLHLTHDSKMISNFFKNVNVKWKKLTSNTAIAFCAKYTTLFGAKTHEFFPELISEQDVTILHPIQSYFDLFVGDI